MKQTAETLIKELALGAGITVNGSYPWDIQVFDNSFYSKIMSGGSVALGETYMQGLWSVENLDQFFERVFLSNIESQIKTSWAAHFLFFKSRVFNRQSNRRAFIVGRKHYDIDNHLYELMLDPNMVYSCGYWDHAQTLEQAQDHKLDLICRKLHLKPGMKFLDVGCGWGSLVKFAVQKFGVDAVGITISKQQARLANEHCKDLQVEIRVQDYRSLDQQQFDAISSVGMIEHVGYKNYRNFMRVIERCLKPDGQFLLHTVGNNYSEFHTDPWIEKYIFPNSMLPSLSQLAKATENILSIHDLHSFGKDYDLTLMAWHQNFVNNWSKIKDKYDQTFFRMWEYYLQMSAAGFRAGRMQVWQLLMTNLNHKGKVKTIR